MPAPSSARLPRWCQALLVVLLGVLATGLFFQRLAWADWGQPYWLEGDPLEVYTRVQIAAEQPGHSLLHFDQVARLGAPTGADWSGYPVPDRLFFVLTGLLSRGLGLFAAINLVGALLTGLNAASFYLCARWLRCRWEWALALGLVFAFSNYNVRWGITLSLNQTFVYPPLILLCAWATRRGAARPGPAGWKILATGLGLWLGISNPYLAYFAGVVAGGALLLALLRRNPWPRKIPLLIFLGCLLACFLASNASYIGQHLRGLAGQALQRNQGDLQVYALHPLEWLIPPADNRLPVLANLGRLWQGARHASGEFFYNYLGLPGVIALAGLLAAGGLHLLRHQWSRLDACLGLAWITAFGVAGGINNWLGTVGLEIFRASTRIGIFAHIWVGFFAALWLTGRSRRLPRILSLLAAAAFALAAVWEETPALGDNQEAVNRIQARWHRYQDAMARLELSLPPGAAVFQLPAIPFPEAGPTLGLPDYEHVLPYLASHTLRFSYGHLRTAPAMRWTRYVSRLPPAQMVAALQSAGFSALWLDQRAYADDGDGLINALHEFCPVDLLPPDTALPVRVLLLQPAATPQMPDFGDPRMQEPWLDGTGESDQTIVAGRPQLLALHGWFAPETAKSRQWRWAARSATLGLWSETGGRANLRFRLDVPTGSGVLLLQEGRTLRTLLAGPAIQEVELSLAQGLTKLEWRLNGPTFRPGGTDPRELGFMVENLSVSVP